MSDKEREARAAGWDDDGLPFEGFANALNLVAAAVFVAWFVIELFQRV